jgi:hypothetical protein
MNIASAMTLACCIVLISSPARPATDSNTNNDLHVFIGLTDSLVGGIDLPAHEGNDFYRSIAQFTGSSACTASFIKTSYNPAAPAYLLTAGHCVQNPADPASANRIMVETSVEETAGYPFVARFNYFHDTQDNTLSIPVSSIAYSTMKGVDLAVLQTAKTIGEMKAMQLEPFELDNAVPAKNMPIIVSGTLLGQGALTLARCNTGLTTDVVENYWHWYNLISNNCQGVSTVSAGGPVFADTPSRPLIAMTNTTNVAGTGDTCYWANPCAVGDDGPLVQSNTNYAAPVAGLSECFDDSGKFALGRHGCPLPAPSGIEVSDYPPVYSGLSAENADTWAFRVSSPTGAITALRTKVINLNMTHENCQNINNYGPPISLSEFKPGMEPLPKSHEGVNQYCIISSDNTGANSPEVVQVMIDNVAPTARPNAMIAVDGAMIEYRPVYMPPEYSDFYMASGPLGSLDCAQAAFKHYAGVPFRVSAQPITLCLYGYDMAHNRSRTLSLDYVPMLRN